jgi:hypothetical protein
MRLIRDRLRFLRSKIVCSLFLSLLSIPSYAGFESLDPRLHPYYIEALLVLRGIPSLPRLVQRFLKEVSRPYSASNDSLERRFLERDLEEYEDTIADNYILDTPPITIVTRGGQHRFVLTYEEFQRLQQLSPYFAEFETLPGQEIPVEMGAPLLYLLTSLLRGGDTRGFLEHVRSQERSFQRLEREVRNFRCGMAMAMAQRTQRSQMNMFNFLALTNHPEFRTNVIFSYSNFLTEEEFLLIVEHLDNNDVNQRNLKIEILTQFATFGFPNGRPPEETVKQLLRFSKELKRFDLYKAILRKWEQFNLGEQIQFLTNTPRPIVKRIDESPFSFENYTDQEIAEAMTEWHFHLFLEIKVSEFRHYPDHKERAKSFHRISQAFEAMSEWLKKTVDSKEDEDKILLLRRLIHIAERLRRLGDYNGAFSLFLVLNDNKKIVDTFRLLDTVKRRGSLYDGFLEQKKSVDLFELFDMDRNWKEYRDEIRHFEGQGLLPVLPIITKDYTMMSTKIKSSMPIQQTLSIGDFLKTFHLQRTRFSFDKKSDPAIMDFFDRFLGI